MARLDRYSIKDLAESLRELTKTNPDFNEKKVWKGMVEFLNGVAIADGVVHELEELFIEKIAEAFSKNPWIKVPLPSLPTPWRRQKPPAE